MQNTFGVWDGSSAESAEPPRGAAPSLAIACVRDEIRFSVLEWAASRQTPGYVCFTASHVLQLGYQGKVGLIVLGDPPDAPVFETVRALREVKQRAPILYTPSDDGVARKTAKPPPGIDHMMGAPFCASLLVQHLERLWSSQSSSASLVAGPIHLELGTGQLRVNGELIPLHGKRLELLAYLVRHAGRAVSKTELALTVIGSLRGDPRRVAKDVCAVRAALGRAAPMVETCAGGYRLNASARVTPGRGCVPDRHVMNHVMNHRSGVPD